jgi:hypothetical protein
MFSIGLMNHLQGQGCKNPENQAALEQISVVAPSIWGSKGGKLLHVTSMVRRILMWLLDFLNTCTSLNFKIVWPCIVIDSLWIKPTDALSSNFIGITYQCRYTAKNSWWGAERLPETCRVTIPIKLELSASVGFIHKELYIPVEWYI